MTALHLSAGFSDTARDGAHAFRAILTAMARPGTIATLQTAPGPAPISPAAATVLLTLCDRTTPLHLAGAHDSPALRNWIAFHCASPLVAAEDAAFALGDWAALQPIDRFGIGTPEYPDRAATLIVDGHDFDAAPTRLTGPGIRDTAALALPEPQAFAANHALFPLGWDAILTSGNRLAALPRSTEIH
ncbi:phosphonate C-P lyase system protein PhnH [Paracoccus alkanivorans]|uniref:Phosphonate C-P lyase system protein PhnH n=1 Tax=Paracoccus alkanivorans TaxID=2116655 RepID=A0A3M0MEC4_9RHOB|nr:phosphonate C-P lyase system protein PhnH [Paracoccus alkanivorans]RMC35453.1 phosphonate C-P lyase system protein PhnH [Paracoccus alkanivorans]